MPKTFQSLPRPGAAVRAAVLAAVLAVPAAAFGQGAPAPAKEMRFAVVDMDRVMAESDMGRLEQANLDKMKADRTSLIAAKQKELDQMEEQIRNASLSWTDEKRDETSRTYNGKQIELKRLNEDATRDVQTEFQRALSKLQKAALEVTGEIGRERGFTMIFEKNTSPVLFASDGIEITPEVIQRLNAKSKSPAPSAQKPAPPAPSPKPPTPSTNPGGKN